MNDDSPFSNYGAPSKQETSLIVHVNFCHYCHYVWKAPGPAEKCVNCIQDVPQVVSLINYRTEVPLT